MSTKTVPVSDTNNNGAVAEASDTGIMTSLGNVAKSTGKIIKDEAAYFGSTAQTALHVGLSVGMVALAGLTAFKVASRLSEKAADAILPTALPDATPAAVVAVE